MEGVNNIMLKDWINTVQNMDCIEAMDKLPDNSIDLVIADPPYNLSKGGKWVWDNSVDLNGMGGNWSKMKEDWDNMTFKDYLAFTESWLTKVKKILKPTGSIWVFGTYHNIGILNVIFQKLNIEILNEIIWYKRNAFPNLSGRRYTASHETILWGHVGENKREYYFDYDFTKKASCPEDNLKKPGKQMRTVWDIPNNKKKEELAYGKHPSQKPLRVLRRMILSTSKPNDICLTPFAGAASECVAAKELGRRFIGFELEKKYVELSNQRLENTQVKTMYQENTNNNFDNKNEVNLFNR